MNKPMKILLTGASGMLGSDIVISVASHPEISLIKTSLKARPGFISADISTENGIATLKKLDWNAVIHTAAWKNPDSCEKMQAETEAINTIATGHLAQAAAERGAPMLYISTDYVFPGTRPPYDEFSIPYPLNVYGRTKLAGEKLLLETCGNKGIVLRIPFLYGLAAGLEQCPLLDSTLKALDSDKPWEMNDSAIRFPTWTGDVAAAAFFLLKKEASGIFHFSALESYTRYTITKTIAELLGKPMDKIVRSTSQPSGEALRPEDAHLAVKRLVDLGFPKVLPFKERLKHLLPWLKKG